MSDESQWYQNYMEQLRENVELKKQIKELEDKLQAIQEILTPKQAEETSQGVSVFMQNKQKEQQ